MKSLNPILISGKEVLPLVEGGKGINGSDGRSSGAWAHENCVGTFSGVSPDFYDDKGNVVIEKFLKRSRPERHEEMVERAIKGGIAQAQVAHEVSGGNGRIHMNMLWELADSQRILEGVLEKAKGLINGITCGAGMPYHLGALASKFGVYYYPIVSSARAFNILWKRAYSNFTEFLGGVVYEDPWLAGGHNGLSNAEDPTKPETPYNRVAELRRLMNGYGLTETAPLLAGAAPSQVRLGSTGPAAPGVQLRLELYTNEELSRIVTRSAALLGIEIDPAGAHEIASRSRGTPRIANRLLRRVRDFAQVYYDGVITKEAADHALGKLEVDHLGLDAIDRRMLTAIIQNYGGGPVGLETLAATIGEEAVTLEDVYEPYLMQIGFLTRTPRGRCVTQLAYEHLHLPAPQSAQPEQLSF